MGDLMWTAAHCLPEVCGPGEPRATQVVVRWMERETFSHRTLGEVLRVAPCVLAGMDRSSRRNLLRGQLEKCSHLLCSWHLAGGYARSDASQMLDWEISARYWAIVGLWME